MKIIVLLFLLLSSVAASTKEAVETSSDILVVAIPVAGLTQTLLLKDYKGTAQLAIGVASAQAVTQTLKVLIDKERPSGEDMKSMPSGHSTTAFQSASFIHFRYGIINAIPHYVTASYVVWARIYTENHYIEDTLVGASIGVLTSWIITDRYKTEKVSVSTSYNGLDDLAFGINYNF